MARLRLVPRRESTTRDTDTYTPGGQVALAQIRGDAGIMVQDVTPAGAATSITAAAAVLAGGKVGHAPRRVSEREPRKQYERVGNVAAGPDHFLALARWASIGNANAPPARWDLRASLTSPTSAARASSSEKRGANSALSGMAGKLPSSPRISLTRFSPSRVLEVFTAM